MSNMNYFAGILFLVGMAFSSTAHSAYEFKGQYYDSNNEVMSPDEVAYHHRLVAERCNAEWNLAEQAQIEYGTIWLSRAQFDSGLNDTILYYADRLKFHILYEDKFLGGPSAHVAEMRGQVAEATARARAKPGGLYEQSTVLILEYALCKALAAERLEQEFKSGSSEPASTVSLPKPSAGAVDAPVIMGTSTNGPTRITTSGTTVEMSVPIPWKGRVLTLTPELASLKPVDAFVDFFSDGGINIFLGKDYQSAFDLDAQYVGRNPGDEHTSCSQVLGKTTVGWFAVFHVAHQLPSVRSINRPQDLYSIGITCGAATMEEAISGAYDIVKRNSGGKPLSTFRLQAGVTAEVDYARLRLEKRLSDYFRPAPLAAWTFGCEMPTDLEAAQGSFMPRDPGDSANFVKYIKEIPALQAYSYPAPLSPQNTTEAYVGCDGYYNTPLENQPPPVFTPR